MSEPKSCSECMTLLKGLPEPNGFHIHFNVATFGLSKEGSIWKSGNTHLNKKKETLDDLKIYVSALQNTAGGNIAVHFFGLEDGDSYIGHFDEYVGGSFNDIIANGHFFISTYFRKWIPNSHLLISVEQSDVVCTVSFNSKQGTDHELLDITLDHILTVLSSGAGTDTEPKVRGLQHLDNTFEDRNIELKAFKPKNIANVTKNVSTFTDYLWSGLKLRDNLSAMTKVAGGGSYYIGVSEVKKYKSYNHGDPHLANTVYETKRPEKDGLKLPFPEDDIRQEIYKKITTHVSVLKTSCAIKRDIKPTDLICIEFHKVPDTSKHVIEVAIGQVRGIVFYDKDGPRSYYVKENGEAERIPFEVLVDNYRELAPRRQSVGLP